MLWLLVFYGAACALLYLFQSRLLYFPEKTWYATPRDIGLAFENITLKSEDGLRLSAWHIPAEGNRATLLLCHGNAGNISHRLEYVKIFNQLGLNTFLFDYRGFGASEGEPSEEGTYLDALAAWRFLVEEAGVPPERILLMGKSLGGAVAAWLATQKPVGGLVLQSTFTSLPELAQNLYPIFPVRQLARYRYETAAYLKKANVPVLIVHSVQDEIVPFRMARQLFDAAAGPRTFLELQGGHNTAFWTSRDLYQQALERFLAEFF